MDLFFVQGDRHGSNSIRLHVNILSSHNFDSPILKFINYFFSLLNLVIVIPLLNFQFQLLYYLGFASFFFTISISLLML